MLPQLQQVASLLVAQAAPEGGGGSPFTSLFPVIAMMAILYFVWIRPAGKERKNHATMLEALKRGDEVITSSGIIGTVADIDNRIITLEVARNVKIRVVRSAIAKKTEEPKPKSDEKDKSSEGAKAQKS